MPRQNFDKINIKTQAKNYVLVFEASLAQI